ncbi:MULTISPECIES: ABC transporter permease [Desulfovibrio]|uniref:Glycine betaine/proline transport system permease protein n=1 Tax=Desulfovibrio desulfuricans TaxID=876 RepID=A0AA94L146_DESDE|nr:MULTISPECIES: proline/glycine betaine ABC transporter permease [Desulfovibrio]ATD81692.1 ABC transporter permease [Desulfovibrio sp. G11]SFW17643.1 glycine betaine/proline transport system permease protein [Desulfovibrio desulfuricans]SPD34416.1 ABC transporter, inner membrane component [Desulfovibrio sp. G11]
MLPRLPLAGYIDSGVEFLVEQFSGVTRAGSAIMLALLDRFEEFLLLPPPWLFILLLAALAWWVTRRPGLPVFVALGFALLWNLGLWAPTISTLALVLSATLLSVLVGVPCGILAAMSPVARKIVMPVLDVMQTMPAFVYLIPAIPFFGIGKVSAVVATVIFSVPPAIRFTCLGIQQVPRDLVECTEAFGATRMQRLYKLELPLAMPTIVAGVNQTIMLALSMAVIAAMIGARGLGGEVWKAIQRLNIGMGFEAGLGIVIVAITLDRLFRALAQKSSGKAH